jgi:hypothetical protein
MRTLVSWQALDEISFLGVLLGMGLLLVSFFVGDWRSLAVPALIVLFPSLVYGMR